MPERLENLLRLREDLCSLLSLLSPMNNLVNPWMVSHRSSQLIVGDPSHSLARRGCSKDNSVDDLKGPC